MSACLGIALKKFLNALKCCQCVHLTERCCLFSHRTAADEYTLLYWVILLSFIFPSWLIDLDFFFFLLGTVVKCNWCTVMFILCYIFSCHKKVLFFPEKLLKMLFCTSLPLTKQTGRFWRLDSVFRLFHLSVCLASGMWSLANNAQPVQTIVNLSTANQQKEYLTQIVYMVTSPAQDKLHIW